MDLEGTFQLDPADAFLLDIAGDDAGRRRLPPVRAGPGCDGGRRRHRRVGRDERMLCRVRGAVAAPS